MRYSFSNAATAWLALLEVKPQRYCIVISNIIRAVAAIAKMNQDGTYELVYKSE